MQNYAYSMHKNMNKLQNGLPSDFELCTHKRTGTVELQRQELWWLITLGYLEL